MITEKKCQARHEHLQLDRVQLEEYWQKLVDENFVADGYVWMSDRAAPHTLLEKQKLPSWKEMHAHAEKSFIYEAKLYAKDKQSISIKQINDGWLVDIVYWTGENLETCLCLENEYLASFNQKLKIVVREAWMEKKDELCENMEVLQPTWTAFYGFKEGENS